ncbi:MAG: hypothetical protein PHD41_05050 [Methanosarcinaceae archaeon]|nr:hypothetical protein [Methanosarcinaceae archaeon]MDD4331591.1 hypothetical protein [Methanosarcinaceae archaeon]MDD4749104.1 hypothetical protein [Methanosarcinaceae archaeon]
MAKEKIKPFAEIKHEKTYQILLSLFIATILLYSFYQGQLFWGIVATVLILRLFLLLRQESFYFREREKNGARAGTYLGSELKRKRRLANIAITLFVLLLLLFSYYTFQLRWGIIAGLMILLYLHMFLFSGERF